MNVPFLTRPKPARGGGSPVRPRGGSRGAGRAGGANRGKGRGKGASSGGGRTSASDSPLKRLRDDALSRRGAVARVLMAALACAAIVAAVRGWEPAFRYRAGDYSGDGIAARVGFEIEDRVQTESRRAAAAAAVATVFRNRTERLDGLPAKFRQDLETLALSETWEGVPVPVRAAFGLAAPETGPEEDAARREEARRLAEGQFQQVRNVLRGQVVEGDDSRPAAAARLDTLTEEFARFVAALGRVGTLTPETLQTADLAPESNVTIIPADAPAAIVTAPPEAPPRPGVERDLSAETRLIGPLLASERLDEDWNALERLPAMRAQVTAWLIRNGLATLEPDPEATAAARRAAREAVAPAVTAFPRDRVLVPPASVVDADALDLLAAEHAALVARTGPAARLVRAGFVSCVIGVLAGLIGYFLWRNERRLAGEPGRLAGYLAVVVVAVAVGRALSFDPWRAEAIPVVACAMTFAVAYNQWLAALTGLAVSAVVVFSTTAELGHLLVLCSAASASVLPLAKVPSRSTVISVGFFTAAAYLIVSLGVGLIERRLGLADSGEAWEIARPAVMNGLRGAGWCLLAAYLVAGSLPFIERAFGVVTDISLLEMSDVSHPLLQDLVRRAPGTYNHSIAMATIGETAADAIGANGLLLRVAAYYHDAGKMLKPHYFIENQTAADRGRHDELAPAMSTLIIIGHVRDGVDLAKQHGLPQRIIDFIEQHHGTTLVKYFYHEAGKRAEATPGHEGDAEESAFRYPGPKPQTREAGVMMLADAVESATRSLSDPTPGSIENLVHALTMDRLLDGQFDESGLTLQEIRTVEASLVKSLIGMHHGRIKYPDQKAA